MEKPAIVLVRGEPNPRLLANSDAPSGVTTTSAALLQLIISTGAIASLVVRTADSPTHTDKEGSTTLKPDCRATSSPAPAISYVVSLRRVGREVHGMLMCLCVPVRVPVHMANAKCMACASRFDSLLDGEQARMVHACVRVCMHACKSAQRTRCSFRGPHTRWAAKGLQRGARTWARHGERLQDDQRGGAMRVLIEGDESGTVPRAAMGSRVQPTGFDPTRGLYGTRCGVGPRRGRS